MTLTITLTNLTGRDSGDLTTAFTELFNLHKSGRVEDDGTIDMETAKETADRCIEEIKSVVISDLESYELDEVPDHFHSIVLNSEERS